MHPNSHHTRSTLPRAAFSLVEILIVLAIMGILAGLAFALLGQTGQIARDAATKSGIQFIQSALDDRIRGFENITQPMMLSDPDLPMKPELREFRKRVQEFYALYDASNTPPRSAMPSPSISPIWEVYVRKALFKAAFPQREEDLYGMDGVSDYETSPNTYVDDSPILSRMWDTAGSTWAATPCRLGWNGSGSDRRHRQRRQSGTARWLGQAAAVLQLAHAVL
jgi:prepilin-type N-terminal cleavage/methylation domain-containing protein